MPIRSSSLALAAASCVLLGCEGAPLAPTGTIHVSVRTSGGDPDLDGYQVILDGGSPLGVPVQGEATVADLALGPHTLELTDVASNCGVAGDNPITVTLDAGITATRTFDVACVATGIELSTVTLGLDGPPSYALLIDGALAGTTPATGTVMVGRLAPGDHTVELEGGEENCTFSGDNPRSVSIPDRQTVPVSFSVSCVAVTGVIEVTVVTEGLDRDRDGYLALIDGVLVGGLADQTPLTHAGVAGGEHTVTIGDVASNCTIDGEASRSVTLTTGEMTRDVARVTFRVECAQNWSLAFTRLLPGSYGVAQPQIFMARADGTDQVPLTYGDDPEWSPDGSRLVWAQCHVYDYYYGDVCSFEGLRILDVDTHAVVELTGSVDRGPSWSPDGETIAFVRGSALYRIGPDGGTLVLILPPGQVGSIADPAWSPDGLELAFACRIDSDDWDICTIASDGTGLTRITTDPARDVAPAWSPSGAEIAFGTTRFGSIEEIAVMASDGTGVTGPLPRHAATQPTWTADGSAIIAAGWSCDLFEGCAPDGLFSVAPDGSGLTKLTMGRDYAPAWRR